MLWTFQLLPLSLPLFGKGVADIEDDEEEEALDGEGAKQ